MSVCTLKLSLRTVRTKCSMLYALSLQNGKRARRGNRNTLPAPLRQQAAGQDYRKNLTFEQCPPNNTLERGNLEGTSGETLI
jgi:hypothetical protein